MCHELRVRHRLKQKDVAEAIGVATSTAGNIEYSRFRVVSDEKAAMLANFYKLGPKSFPTRDAFMAASAALQVSEYTQKQREDWAKRNQVRSKSRRFDRMCAAVDNIVCMLAAEGRPCTCSPGIPADFEAPAVPEVVCPLCEAMLALGVSEGYGSPDVALERLAALHAAKPAAEGARQ